jgi:hypothetical protein
MIIEVTISGLTPLIFDKFYNELLVGKESRAVGKGVELLPLEQAKVRLYLDPKGKAVLPQEYLLRAIIDAGRFIKVGKRQLSTRDETIVTSFLALEGVYYSIESKSGWRVDSRGIVNQKTKDRVICHRPIFDDWTVKFSIDFDESECKVSIARELVDRAGKAIGIGVMRPSRKGPYGRFKVVKWVEKESIIDMQQAAE